MKNGEQVSSIGKESGFIDLCSRPRYENSEYQWLQVVDSCPSAGMRLIALAFDLIVVANWRSLFCGKINGLRFKCK